MRRNGLRNPVQSWRNQTERWSPGKVRRAKGHKFVPESTPTSVRLSAVIAGGSAAWGGMIAPLSARL